MSENLPMLNKPEGDEVAGQQTIKQLESEDNDMVGADTEQANA